MPEDTTTSERRSFNLTKTIVLSALLGAFAIIVALIYFFPYQTGIALGILGCVVYAVINSVPPVKRTTSHTVTTKKG